MDFAKKQIVSKVGTNEELREITSSLQKLGTAQCFGCLQNKYFEWQKTPNCHIGYKKLNG